MISVGFTRGIILIVRQSRQTTTHISTKNMTGSHVARSSATASRSWRAAASHRSSAARGAAESASGTTRVSSSRQAASAASATSSCSGVGSASRSGAGARGRAREARARAAGRGDAASSRRSRSPRRPRRPTPPARAAGGSVRGAREARTLPARRSRAAGPTRCEPQRSCSFAAARRARSCRSRCARRRGRRRATPPRSASTAGATESSPPTSSLRRVAEPRAADRVDRDAALPTIEASTARPLERQLRLGQRALQPRQERERLERASPGRAGAAADARADEPLPLGDDLQLAVGGADGAGPRRRAVHEHAVRERHPTEPDLLSFASFASSAIGPRVLVGDLLEERPAAARQRRRAGSRGRRRRPPA